MAVEKEEDLRIYDYGEGAFLYASMLPPPGMDTFCRTHMPLLRPHLVEKNNA
jgi:hypothetical protein